MSIQIIKDKKEENNYCNQYLAECSFCHTKITYLGLDISFHRNYPNGYVYCPRCKRPIAHDEANKYDSGKSSEEIRRMVVESLENQKAEAIKTKNGASILGGILMLLAVVALVFGAIGMPKDPIYIVLLFVGFLLVAFAIISIVAIASPASDKIEKTNNLLDEIEEKDA